MDDLKYINDNFGHNEGDYGLKTIAYGLARAVNGNEVCARAGGDEFTIIVTGITEEELGKRVEAVREVSQKYDHVCFAIGQCYDDSKSNVRQALRIADERMYEDKRKFYEKHPELKR